MGKSLKLGVLAFACLMAFGCSAKHAQHEDYSTRATQEQRFRRSYEAVFDKNSHQASEQVLRKARSAIGTPYVSGGMSPGGFDCSGFVCWAYRSVGVNLPRTAQEQSVVGKRVKNVEDMQVGDIVAFRHPRRGYHTGIYVGDGRFIHSPHRRARVQITSLDDPYFRGTFLGARRVKMDGTENLVADAEKRLNDFAEEKAVRDISRKRSAVLRKGKSTDEIRDRSNGNGKKNVKSRKKIVEVASLNKSQQSSGSVEVRKPGKSSASAGPSSARVVGDSKKADGRRTEVARTGSHDAGDHKGKAVKNETRAGSSKSQPARSDAARRSLPSSASKSKADRGKATARVDSKKSSSKKRGKTS